MSDKTKDKVAEKMKKETPLTDKFQIGLSPVTHLRKYFIKKGLKGKSKRPKGGWTPGA
tara:strand:+ start:61 stop:234 length:174 start_codon:yes stop_codon:yes gene_type:complete